MAKLEQNLLQWLTEFVLINNRGKKKVAKLGTKVIHAMSHRG